MPDAETSELSRDSSDFVGAVPAQNQSTSRRGATGVRQAYADWITNCYPTLAPDAPALALAVYPWPVRELAPSVLLELIGEMTPLANLRHPDIRQVAADRLLRLAEVVAAADERDLREMYLGAATSLGESLGSAPLGDAIYGLVSDPLGLGPRVQPSGGSERLCLAADSFATVDSPLGFDELSSLIETVARTGLRDLGELMGEGPLGFDISQITRRSYAFDGATSLDRFISGLDERMKDIATERLFSIDPRLTYEELGQQWGVTRERIRQLLGEVTERFEIELSRSLEPTANVIRHLSSWVIPTDRIVTAAGLFAPTGPNEQLVTLGLLAASGPWVHNSGWSMHTTLAPILNSRIDSLLECADGYGALADHDILEHLDGLFLQSNDLERYLIDHLGFVKLQGVWSSRGSQRARIAAALRSLGRPATKREISAAAGLADTVRVGNVLASLEGVVRADKDRWALAAWVEDPYEGIVGEINQRIDQRGGAVRVDLLLEEIPRLFGVSESSVRTYLGTDAYIVERGLVRRNNADYNPGPPDLHGRAVLIDGQWFQRIALYERHFVGYSLAVAFDVAYANGVRPGDELLLPVRGHQQLASVIWRRHSPNRTIDVGRLSDLLRDLGCRPGDEIQVAPSREEVRIIADSPSDDGDIDDGVKQGVGVAAPQMGPMEPHSIGGIGDIHDPLFDLLDTE